MPLLPPTTKWPTCRPTIIGDKAEQNESKIIRDKAYTHLKELVARYLK